MIKEVNGPSWEAHPTNRREVGFYDEPNNYALLSEGLDSEGVYHALWHPTANGLPFIVDKITRHNGKWTYTRELEGDSLSELILRYLSLLKRK